MASVSVGPQRLVFELALSHVSTSAFNNIEPFMTQGSEGPAEYKNPFLGSLEGEFQDLWASFTNAVKVESMQTSYNYLVFHMNWSLNVI